MDSPANTPRREKEAIPATSIPLSPCPGPRHSLKIPPAIAGGLKRSNGGRDQGIFKDFLYIILRDGVNHLVSENYFYKTEPYYTILKYEMEGRPVRPSTSDVLDAYVVPICLERAKQAGIPVCSWEISQGYVPLPAIIYGLNYFAASSDYVVVNNGEKAKEVIRHVTNKGKYPFCYQKLPGDATIHTCIGIFGKTVGSTSTVARLAARVYEVFSIPLVTMVFIRVGEDYLLSSLSPTKYSQLSGKEKSILTAYLSNQAFL
jgi:hypothetical protein